MSIKIIQYDCNFIMSIRQDVSNRLPYNVFKKIRSYDNKRKYRQHKNNLNKFILSRNPDSINLEELQKQVKKEVTGLLNRVTLDNLERMSDNINHIIELINKVKYDNRSKVHHVLMSGLLNTRKRLFKIICENIRRYE